MRRTYRVACLAGDGLGPELMAQATRTLRKVARMHGFAVEDVHAPFGSEALTRSGHPLPPGTRSAVLESDAVLVATAGEPALTGVESELDLQAGVTRALFRRGDFTLLTPLAPDADNWTVERAFELARRTRGRLVSVEHDGRWATVVDAAAAAHEAVAVERLSLAETVRALALEPERLDVVVASGAVAPALAELAAGTDGDRLVASGRLAASGPSVFAPSRAASTDDAGHGVADPSSMLLATALMLREGLRESHAADTLTAALSAVRGGTSKPAASLRRTLSASTRDFADAVVSLLPSSHRNAEFLPEALA